MPLVGDNAVMRITSVGDKPHTENCAHKGERRRSNSHDIELFQKLGISSLFTRDFFKLGFSFI